METDGKLATIRLGGQSGCSACDAGRGCGAGVFGKLLRRRPAQVQLDNTIDAECGQAVIVGLSEALFLNLVLRIYLLSLAAGLVGGVFGHYLALRIGTGAAITDLLTLGFAVLGGSLALWKSRASSSEFSEISTVHLLRAVGEQETKEEVCL